MHYDACPSPFTIIKIKIVLKKKIKIIMKIIPELNTNAKTCWHCN